MPIILILFVIAVKLSKSSFDKFGIYRHILLLEKMTISKDVCAVVLKVGDEGIVGVSSANGFETIKTLTKEEVELIEKKKTSVTNFDISKVKFDISKLKLNKKIAD